MALSAPGGIRPAKLFALATGIAWPALVLWAAFQPNPIIQPGAPHFINLLWLVVFLALAGLWAALAGAAVTAAAVCLTRLPEGVQASQSMISRLLGWLRA